MKVGMRETRLLVAGRKILWTVTSVAVQRAAPRADRGRGKQKNGEVAKEIV